MKNIVLSLLLACICFLGCSKNDSEPFCDVNDPTQELTWLKDEIKSRNTNPTTGMEYCYIAWGKYNGNDVIVYGDCNPLIDKVIPIYNCTGELLNHTESEISIDKIVGLKTIWTPDNFVCKGI